MIRKTSKIAVAISVYSNDTAENVAESLNSLVKQSYKYFDVFLMIDGPIDEVLESVLMEFKSYDNFNLYYEKNNKGLAFQLNKAISKILSLDSYSYLARMDADDICHEDRFLEQVSFFNNNPTISVLGTGVVEFGESIVDYIKIMPKEHCVLRRDIIKKCPLNHPTVMFNLVNFKHEDLKYNDNLMNTQDYYLWVDLMSKGYLFANLPKVLLKFRIDGNFHSRRGFKKAINDFNSRIYAMNKLEMFSIRSIIHAILLFVLRVSPSSVKKIAYKKLR